MATSPRGGVFLSYRREDTEHLSGRLGDWIALRFGQPRLFMDVDSIPPGADFVKAIELAVGGCDVLLAVIGPRWTTAVDDQGRRRLDDPEDFVVQELRAALVRDIPVIPVLVDGAAMPKKHELPADLQPMVRRNFVRLDAETFRQDSEWLLDQLATMLPGSTDEPRAGSPVAALEDPATARRPADDPPAGAVSVVQPESSRPLRVTTTLNRRTLLRLGVGAAGLGGGVLGVMAFARNWGAGDGGPAWRFVTSDEVYSSPAVAAGVVYIGSNDRHLYALDAISGTQLWRYATDGAVTSSPAVVDRTVYVGSNDNHVHAIGSDGQPRWRFETGAAMHSSPTVDRGVLYIGCRDHNVYALDAGTGTERWRFTGRDWFNSSPVVVDDTVYIGCRDTNVYALNAQTGEERWRYTTDSTVDSSAAVADGMVVIGGDDHRLYALDARTGAWIWDFDAEQGIVSTPLIAGGVVYVGSDDGNLYALDATTGRERWRHPTSNGIRSSAALADGVVYVGSRDFALYAVDAGTGKRRWSFATGAPIDDSSPAVADGLVYIGSLDHALYALSAASGAAA